MVFWDWLTHEWFTLLQSASIVSGFLFTAFALRSETKTRQISNALAITKNHREIWSTLFYNPKLQRVLDSEIDLKRSPPKREEQIFVNLIILHLNSVFDAMKDKLVLKPEGLREDVGKFFALPIPNAVWNKMKLLHDKEFVSFVESCRTEHSRTN